MFSQERTLGHWVSMSKYCTVAYSNDPSRFAFYSCLTKKSVCQHMFVMTYYTKPLYNSSVSVAHQQFRSCKKKPFRLKNVLWFMYASTPQKSITKPWMRIIFDGDAWFPRIELMTPMAHLRSILDRILFLHRTDQVDLHWDHVGSTS